MKGAPNLGVILLLLTYSALAQQVVQSWDVPCSEETVKPNLELKEPHRFYGELKDEAGAPLAESRIVLRKVNSKGTFAAYKAVTTDKEGRFDLGTVKSGKYRFLPSPHRGFKQPKEVVCEEGHDCEVKLVLRMNPSDQEFCGCPIQ